MMRFSILVPVYQNELNLHDTVPRLLDIKNHLNEVEVELIIVDDGSTDKSLEIIIEYQKKNPDIKVIKLNKNYGQISAIQAGLHYVSGDCVAIISADLQDDPDLLLEMYHSWSEGNPYIIAERKNREENIFHKAISNFIWFLVSNYAVKGYPGGGYDFCIIDKSIVEEINKINEKNTHIFVLIFSLGYKPKIHYYNRKIRKAGKSQWTFFKKIKLIFDTFIAFSYLPVRLISFFGIVFSAVSFLVGLVIIYQKIFYGNPYTGWTSIFVLLSFTGGMILLSLGIIGEYLWRILDEVRKRPHYVVEKIFGGMVE